MAFIVFRIKELVHVKVRVEILQLHVGLIENPQCPRCPYFAGAFLAYPRYSSSFPGLIYLTPPNGSDPVTWELRNTGAGAIYLAAVGFLSLLPFFSNEMEKNHY